MFLLIQLSNDLKSIVYIVLYSNAPSLDFLIFVLKSRHVRVLSCKFANYRQSVGSDSLFGTTT